MSSGPGIRAGLLACMLVPGLSAQPAGGDGLEAVVEPTLEGRPRYQKDPKRDHQISHEVGMGDVDSATEKVMLDRTRIGAFALLQAREVQPFLRIGNRAGGLRGAWDSAESCPPQALRVGGQWEPEGGARDLGYRSFGDVLDPEHAYHWKRRGAVHYHDLLENRDGRRSFLHRFVYYFPWGKGDFGGHIDPHAVWVEVRQRLDPDEAERGRWVARARRDLERQRDHLKRYLAANPGDAGSVQGSLAKIEELLAGEVNPPPHLAIDRVVVSDPVPVRGGKPWKLRIYGPDDLEFERGRPVLHVTEGNHRFLARIGEMRWLEECDAPWVPEPHGRLPIIDLRDHKTKENPLAERARGAKVPLLPGMLDNEVLLVGFQEAAWRKPADFEGTPFGPPPLRKPGS